MSVESIGLPSFGAAPEPKNARTLAEMGVVISASVEVHELFHEKPQVCSMGMQNYAKAGPCWFNKKQKAKMKCVRIR